MKITFFGVRGSCPCSSPDQARYGGNTSCVVVEAPGDVPLILDLGTGLRTAGQYLLGKSRGPVRANALLSHLHYDHILGLPFYTPLQDPDAALTIYGPAGKPGDLGANLHAAVQPPYFPATFGDFPGSVHFVDLVPETDLVIGSLSVRVRTITHVGLTLGFRIDAADSSVAYLTDHQGSGPDEALEDAAVDLARGADLLIHDAQYTEEEFSRFPTWGHATPSYALRLAEAAGCTTLCLFHHDPTHSDSDVDRMLSDLRAGAGSLAPRIVAAAEGLTISLTKDGAR